MKKKYLLLVLVIGIGSIMNAQDSIKRSEFIYKGFLDVNAHITNTQSGFFIGGLDNYFSAQINDKLSLIGEIIIEPSNSRFRADVDRLRMRYDAMKYLQITIGRFYAPLGYYSTTYFSDRAAIISPTIQRPLVLTFEDDGGMLETKPTGINLSGNNLTSLKLNYDIAISNGLGSKPIDDNDKNKAYTFRLSIEPFEGLHLGGGARFDKIDKNVGDLATFAATVKKPIGEDVTSQIYSTFFAFDNSKWLLLSEYYWFINSSAIAGTQKSAGAFAFIGYVFNERYMPYLKFDYINVSDKEIYFDPLTSTKDLSLGFRYDFSESACLKLELKHKKYEYLHAIDEARIQFAIKF
jgi:predicted porin